MKKEKFQILFQVIIFTGFIVVKNENEIKDEPNQTNEKENQNENNDNDEEQNNENAGMMLRTRLKSDIGQTCLSMLSKSNKIK